MASRPTLRILIADDDRDTAVTLATILRDEGREVHVALAPLLIAISGQWTQKSEEALAHEVGFDHYLLKPCEAGRVLALLEATQRTHSAHRR